MFHRRAVRRSKWRRRGKAAHPITGCVDPASCLLALKSAWRHFPDCTSNSIPWPSSWLTCFRDKGCLLRHHTMHTMQKNK